MAEGNLPSGGKRGSCQALFVEDDRPNVAERSNKTLACTTNPCAHFFSGGGRRSSCEPMVIVRRFGRKLKLPSTVEIKHQLLLRWLEDQTAKEQAEVDTPVGTLAAPRVESPKTGQKMKMLTPRYVNETESDHRGIKIGWYAMRSNGSFRLGPFLNREDCVTGIALAEAETEASKYGPVA